jgi:hypothetical protein
VSARQEWEDPWEGKHILRPFDRKEAISVHEAAKIAGRSERTIQIWATNHHIGRRVEGGPWLISKVALAMFLDGRRDLLKRYLDGDRTSGEVLDYFRRQGLAATRNG